MQINKESSIVALTNSVRMGQRMGAFLIREASLLLDAINYFNDDIKEKAEIFSNTEEPEIVAINLLLQGVQKAQAHGGEHAYSLEDAAYLWKVIDFWIQKGGKEVSQNITKRTVEKDGKSAKSVVDNARVKQEEEEDEELDEIRPMTTLKKGKGKE